MIRFIQRLVKRVAIIYAITVILQLIVGAELNNQRLYELLILSFVISLELSLLFKGIVFDYPLSRRIIFIGLTIFTVLGAYFIFNWHYQMIDIVSIIVTVLIIYFVIRLLTYYQTKDEVNKMNAFLKRRHSDKS